MKRFATPFFLVLVAGVAEGRGPDGLLAILRTPNEGMPAIVVPGGTFEAVLTEKAELRLDAAGAPALTVEWHQLPGGSMKAICTVPPDAGPGAYALEAVVGDRTDCNPRAVFVRESFPPYYIIAHLTDTHIGSNRHFRPANDIFGDLLRVVNERAAKEPSLAFVLITGDLTDGGEPQQFQDFLNILSTCDLPTFVCPGNHDRQGLNYEQVFGPVTYMFRFGEDGYISYDTKDFVIASELGPQDADLQVFRRAIKPCRWSIGFTHRYDPGQGMRSQIVLFIDNPLDLLIFGHVHRENREGEKTVPWGTTPITITPAGVDGALRLIDVTPMGILPRAPEKDAVPVK